MRIIIISILILILLGVVVFAQSNDGDSFLPLIVSNTNSTSSPEDLAKGYVYDCGTTHENTRISYPEGLRDFNQYDKMVYSYSLDGPHQGSISKQQTWLTISDSGPVGGDWWVWLTDETDNRISEAVVVHTDPIPGLGKCQQAAVVFYGGKSSPETDPCANIGGDGCKFNVTGRKFGNNDGTELKLQLLFMDTSVDGGQPQGSYYIELYKGSNQVPISDAVRSVALSRLEGPLGYYNYEYIIPLNELPDSKVDGGYVGWVLDGNGIRDSQDFSFELSSNQGLVWIQFDQAGY